MIGAGIVGVTAASYLQRDGHAVTLVDERRPGEYCSFGNAGIISPGSCVPMALPGVLWQVPGYLADPLGPLALRWSYLSQVLPWLMHFVAASDIRRVEKIADALHALLAQTFDAYGPLVRDAGVADLIHRSGYAVAYSSSAAMETDQVGWRIRRERGVLMDSLDGDELHARVPGLAPGFTTGLFLHDHGWCANPSRLTQALAAHFVRNGGGILQRRVLAVERDGECVSALQTDAGRIPVETLVLCAGAHSREFARQLGEDVPLEAERGYHVTYSDPGIKLPMPVMLPEHKCFVTPMEMGVRIAGQSEFAGIDAAPDFRRADRLAAVMQKVFPGTRETDSTRWMGQRPSMADSLPVIGRATYCANVWYAFGHGHVGLCGGAPTARLLADLIAGRKPTIDPAPYQPTRF